jgi:hypothetical protein
MSHEALGPQFEEHIPPGGRWDRSGEEPRWEQRHSELVADALHSWKGWPTSMGLHMSEELAGAPQPSSGSGKQMRSQAAALIREINERGQTNPRMLYRGSHVEPAGFRAWSERRGVASGWAKKGGGEVYKAPRGTVRGIRVADYIKSGVDEQEREWIIHHR